MGGVINVLSKRPRRRTAEVRTQYGNLGSPKADFAVSDVWGKFAASFDGSAFKTDGFPIVIANERGLVDDKANVEYRNFNLRADYSPTSRLNVFVRGGYFHEERDNGKHSTIDGTEEERHHVEERGWRCARHAPFQRSGRGLHDKDVPQRFWRFPPNPVPLAA
jgi:outer membrane cobalamin receptor